MGERRYCYKCMEKYDSDLHVCPHCGYDDNTPHSSMYMAPGTILRDRYLVGVLLEYNGEGATYIGHDISTDCNVLLREYMPINLCTRVQNKATISVNYNNLAKYKAFMAEYTELNKSLARLRNDSNINPVLDMFAENNTTYTVFEYIEGQKMLDYLKENAGELSWEQVSKLFPPLFTTLGRLHNAGITHRAISPDTVYITDKGELRLSGFCISAVRTADAGLEYELFKGYAAPEQYSASSSSRQGSWTDVYGVCALIYRALTGCMPVDSTDRLKHDDLCEPSALNARIPQHVSRVIMDGMNLSGRDRIQTITELVTRLFEQPAVIKPAASANPAAGVSAAAAMTGAAVNSQPQQNGAAPMQQGAYNPGYYGNQQPNPYQQPVQQRGYPQQYPPPQNYPYRGYDEEDYRYEKVNTVDRIKVPVIIGILLMAILLIIAVVIMSIIAPGKDTAESSRVSATDNNVVEGSVETTTDVPTEAQEVEVPNLVGSFYSLSKDKWKEYFEFDPTYEYNNDYDNDMIYGQDIDAGKMVSKGSVIKVKVSKGKESALVPDYAGRTKSQYQNDLEQAGISSFNYQFLPSTSGYGTPNMVVDVQTEDGQRVSPGTYFSNKEGKKLCVYYVPENAQQVTQAPTESQTEVSTQQETQPVETTTQYVEPITEPVTEAPTEVWTDPPTEYIQTETQIDVPTDTPPEYGGEW